MTITLLFGRDAGKRVDMPFLVARGLIAAGRAEDPYAEVELVYATEPAPDETKPPIHETKPAKSGTKGRKK